ncbi:unnamed protein product [Penicillium olsonii]|uniref:Epidermal growth factor receptor-like transmembrane-juxtamembrane segment domain-containing protein n=1 Tax=Penicillium olsonii TaxID=99116 RepID=A0A9W4HKV3_PENOL|nr:unnamed protein product [Penicillium olsonii]CAG8146687.1 unnamed protein product [Penicillium olsonii]
MTEYVQGYAIRRNESCADNEQKCTKKATWGDYQACCPGNSFCYDSDTGIPNMMCCPMGNTNCTQSVQEEKSCANSTWNLYNWRGYFCCEQGQPGFYVNDRVLVGCSEDSKPGNSSFKLLDILSTGSDSTSTTMSSSTSLSTSPSTASSTPTSATSGAASSNSEKSSSTNTGAIAGGVVGGVVGVAALLAILFFVMRRRKQQSSPQSQPMLGAQSELPSPPVYSEAGSGEPRKELSGQAVSELGNNAVQSPQELPTTR